MVIGPSFIPAINQFLEGAPPAVIDVVAPLAVRVFVVMFLQKLIKEWLNLTFQIIATTLTPAVDVPHDVKDQVEVMGVIDARLFCSRLKNQHPHILVEPANLMQFVGQVKEDPLLVDDLVLPLVDDDLLVSDGQLVEHVAAVQLAVLAESIQQAHDLLDVESVHVLIKEGFPKVNAVARPLV